MKSKPEGGTIVCGVPAKICITTAAGDVRNVVRNLMVSKPEVTEDEAVAATLPHKEQLYGVEFAGFIRDGHTSHLPSVIDWQGPEIEARESYRYFSEHPEALLEAA